MAREYQSIPSLFQIMRHRGLEITDEREAVHFLTLVGHYRLSDYYPAFADSDKTFDTASSKDVFNLYGFDRRFRLLIWGPLEKLEIALRALIIKEAGDFLTTKVANTSPRQINLFDTRLYRISKQSQRDVFERTKKKCLRSAQARYYRRADLAAEVRLLSDQQLEEYLLSKLAAWEIIQATYFSDLTTLFNLLRRDIAASIAQHFELSRFVFASLLDGLRDLRNACAHHEPIWNWDARHRGSHKLMEFPNFYKKDAAISEKGEYKIYVYCAAIHLLLSHLSGGQSTWYRRLKKLINEFNTTYSSAMGFPADWQTLPFWCVPDVRHVRTAIALREKVSSYNPYK